MSILNDIKNQVKKSGTNKGKILSFKVGAKVRVRFLNDMDEGTKVVFHDSWDKGIEVPCQEAYGRDCPYCEDDDGIRTRDQYCWSVWDYEAKEVKVIKAPVNNCSPIPALVAMYDTYGTLTDRDYVITKSGSQNTTSYAVVPMDKVKFRNDKAKPFSSSKLLAMLDKAYPCDEAEEEDKKVSKNKKATSKKSKPDDDEDEDDEVDEEEAEDEYDDLDAKELYKLCKKRGISAKPNKSEKYYIQLLEDEDDMYGDEEEEDDDE